ncbi:MAG: DUF2314 domain-containing protein [Psychrosphaera sp.]|nr:DUF2314 domain-containing protein [Psychrosphaera sp.]
MRIEDNILLSQNDDEPMFEAHIKAQQTFKYFWREISWEHRRIVPGLDLAIVKIIFTDEDVKEGDPSVEHMWIGDIEFDGQFIKGFLMNSPNWLRNISEGDHVKAKVSQVSDWMFACQGKAYGGYTINLLRSRMSSVELKEHDEAWGMDFGEPDIIDLVYTQGTKKRRLINLFRQTIEVDPDEVARALVEHPMSINMGDKMAQALKNMSESIDEPDEEGWTMLQREVVAGNATSVKILLEHGADNNLLNKAGHTPLALAKIMDWPNVIELLK